MIDLPITTEQLNACIASHKEALVNCIRECGRSFPPGDGSIGLIVANLEALAKVKPSDWPTYAEIGDLAAQALGARKAAKK